MAPPNDPTGASRQGSGSGSADSIPQPIKADGVTPDLSVALAQPIKGLPLDEPETHQLAQRGLFDDFLRKPNEGWWPYAKRLCSEGHSVPDAFLTVAASQIGQIMLTCPNALWKTGIVSGSIFMIVAILGSFWTIYLMNALYCEYKRYKFARGEKLTHTTQYHDVMVHHAGKAIGYTAEVFVILQLIGTGIAQVIACAGDWYSVEQSLSKRDMQIIWGAIFQLFVFFPDFRHFRVINIMALVGTTTTAVFLLYAASAQGYANQGLMRLWPAEVVVPTATTSAPQYFFTGAAVLLNAVGGHAIAVEMMDAMETPRQYTIAYTGGWLWTLFLIVPPSIAIDLAFPTVISGSDNVLGIVPMSQTKVACVAMMIAHQIAAFCYYLAPVFFIWERFIGTHNKPWYIRLPSRLPVSLLVWLAAMAFPFYGSINSLMASISVPFTAFALPCLVYNYVYRHQARRDDAPLPPWSFLKAYNWKPIFVFNLILGLTFVGFGGAAIAYSIKSIVDNAKTFGLFAACYQCPSNWQSFLKYPAMNQWQSG